MARPKRMTLEAAFAELARRRGVGESAEIDLAEFGQRLKDKDGDPWVITHHGARMFPEDADRYFDWPYADLGEAQDLFGPFTVAK